MTLTFYPRPIILLRIWAKISHGSTRTAWAPSQYKYGSSRYGDLSYKVSYLYKRNSQTSQTTLTSLYWDGPQELFFLLSPHLKTSLQSPYKTIYTTYGLITSIKCHCYSWWPGAFNAPGHLLSQWHLICDKNIHHRYHKSFTNPVRDTVGSIYRNWKSIEQT